MAMTLIADNTADTTDLASVSFTSGIDSTYKLYIFKVYDYNPATDSENFRFQCSIDSGSNYNTTVTTIHFETFHNEDDSQAYLTYSGGDYAQATTFLNTSVRVGADADQSMVGELFLFNPSNTTYVKHYQARFNAAFDSDGSNSSFTAGYFNTTSAIDAIQFKHSSGNIDAVIKMYGVG